MKKILLIVSIALFFGSCKKKEENLIPSSIYGTYHVTLERITNPKGTYIHTWTITQNTSNTVKINSDHDLVGNPIIMDVNGNTLVINSQSFPGSMGASFTVSGSGTFSNTQINLSLVTSAQGNSLQYSVSAVK